MFRLETTWTTDKNNLYLVREQHARALSIQRSIFYYEIGNRHGRVRPCAKEKLFPKSCFQKSEGSTMNYLRNAQMRITCGKFL